MTDATHYGYAGFWWRVLAALIDWIILIVGIGIVATIVVGAEESLLDIVGTQLVGAVVSWLYYALLESSAKRGTLGKMACGLIVTDLAGARISFGRATGRFLAKFLSSLILLIGYLMVAFTRRKQGLHDMIAGTLVLRALAPAERVALPDAATPAPPTVGR